MERIWIGGEQFVAANVQPCQDDNGLPFVDDPTTMEPTSLEVRSASPETRVSNANGPFDVLHVYKPLGLEELFCGNILGRKADGGTLPDPERGRLGRRLRSDGLAVQPSSPAVPASVIPPRNRRRLNRRACWVLTGTSLPRSGQCDTENASQWTLLPSQEQAQHLTIDK